VSDKLFERTIDIFVVDKNDVPIQGAKIAYKVNGVDAGEVEYAAGRSRISVVKRDTPVEVTASYAGETKTVKLDTNADIYKFKFNVDVGGTFMERHLALVIGLGLFVLAIILAFVFGNPTTLQTRMILGAFSLGGGAIATEISGMLKVDMTLGTKLTIGASGALAIFVILYLVLPA